MADKNAEPSIKVTKNGPYIVTGNVPLFEMIIKCEGGDTPSEWMIGRQFPLQKSYLLCRCGQSKNKPYCDGSHVKVHFGGTEAYDNVPYEEMAKVIDGPQLTLKDAEILCASARFCHRGGDIWQEIPRSNDPKTKQNSIRNTCDCPSGRLVITDKTTGRVVEPALGKSIGVVLDPAIGVEGPLWIRGGIPVLSSDGKPYEARNRMTLCRCGKSTIKPFCDSSHYPEEYQEVKK